MWVDDSDTSRINDDIMISLNLDHSIYKDPMQVGYGSLSHVLVVLHTNDLYALYISLHNYHI